MITDSLQEPANSGRVRNQPMIMGWLG